MTISKICLGLKYKFGCGSGHNAIIPLAWARGACSICKQINMKCRAQFDLALFFFFRSKHIFSMTSFAEFHEQTICQIARAPRPAPEGSWGRCSFSYLVIGDFDNLDAYTLLSRIRSHSELTSYRKWPAKLLLNSSSSLTFLTLCMRSTFQPCWAADIFTILSFSWSLF